MAKAKLICATFDSDNWDGQDIDRVVEDYLNEEGVSQSDILKVNRSESAVDSKTRITLWYVYHPADRDWLTANLPETDEPNNARPGAEYGV